MKKIWILSLLTACAGTLLAQAVDHAPQSTRPVTIKVKLLNTESRPATGPTAPLPPPPIQSIFTIIGPNSAGVPCFDCVTAGDVPNVGILNPAGTIHRGGNFQVDSFVVDNSYNGDCTFTIAVLNVSNKVVAYTQPTFTLSSNSGVLLGTAFDIPTNAMLGLGKVVNIAQCGTSKTVSQSPVYIAP